MVAFDQGSTLADRFRAHARDDVHLYGHVMRGMADDWEAGGVVREVCRGYEDAPAGSLLQLRLVAGVFRLVLRGEAPELVPYYPCLGGEAAPQDAWPVMRTVIAAHADEVRVALEVAPQTNECGRSAALLVGLTDLVRASGRTRVRLLEVGASAGLNLLLEHYRLAGDGWAWGDPDSPVRLDGAVEGPFAPASFEVVERRGCDLHPVDATTEEGRLLLTSFVWPFDLHRHARLAGALEVVAAHPVTLDRAGAAAWLPGVLPTADPDVLTVVWNSITQLYWPAAEVTAVAGLLANAGASQPLARVSMEYAADAAAGAKPEVRTTLWRPGEPVRERLLGTAHDHGIPVRVGTGSAGGLTSPVGAPRP